MMKAGTYVICDLCYVMSESEWDEVCSKIEIGYTGEVTLENGKNIAFYHTQYGDGVYFDQENNEYSVDSGTLGCILVSDLDVELDDSMNIFDFQSDFDTYESAGDIYFGWIEIKTSGENPEDNIDDDYDDWDYDSYDDSDWDADSDE